MRSRSRAHATRASRVHGGDAVTTATGEPVGTYTAPYGPAASGEDTAVIERLRDPPVNEDDIRVHQGHDHIASPPAINPSPSTSTSPPTRSAEALGCELVYFLIPKTTLDDAVRERARAKAARHLDRVAHRSRLEDQELTSDAQRAQQDRFAEDLIDRRGLWADDDL